MGMPQFVTEVWHRRATSLELAVKKLLYLVVVLTFFLTSTLTGSLSDQSQQVSKANVPVINYL